jgi:hypothetical protein
MLIHASRTRSAEYLLAAEAQRDQPPTDDFMLIADNSVHSGGRNIGSDPDQNVRFQMMRDDNSRYGGAD